MASLLAASCLLFFFLSLSRYKFNLHKAFSTAQSDHTSPKIAAVLWFHRHRWIMSPWGHAVIYLASTILVLGSAFLVYYLDPNPGPLPCYKESDFTLMIIECAIISFLGAVALYSLYDIGDAYMFKLEYAILLGAGIPLCIVSLVSYRLAWRGPPHFFFFISITQIVYFLTSIVLPIVASFYFTALINKWRPQDSESMVSTSSVDDELKIALHDDRLAGCFEKHAIASWAEENLVFFRVVEAFKDLPIHQIALEARTIFNTFLAVGESPLLLCF